MSSFVSPFFLHIRQHKICLAIAKTSRSAAYEYAAKAHRREQIERKEKPRQVVENYTPKAETPSLISVF